MIQEVSVFHLQVTNCTVVTWTKQSGQVPCSFKIRNTEITFKQSSTVTGVIVRSFQAHMFSSASS